mgnify:CR=1 FL=1
MNTTQKNKINELCNDILISKINKRKELERTEFGGDADKIDDKVFAKVMNRKSQEADDEIKDSVRRLMKRKTPAEFAELVEDTRQYSDADFLVDIKDIFGSDSALFIQKELKRYATVQ